MSYKYKFSVIMAVYKVEEYIRESIDSLINQSIGFDNLQLILIDDGSPDSSGEICDEYASKYPNIVVVHKENGGVSSARNRGLELVEGEFVNFIDPDDLLTPKAFEKVYKFFRKHYDEVDLVSVPLVFFEGRTGDHMLNFKYEKGTRVVDLREEWFNPQLSLSSSFVKSSVIGDIRFDTRLIYAEDAQLIQKFLIHKQKLGLIADEKYMYRTRISSGSSALQTSGQKPEWFLPCVKYFHMETIALYKEKLGYVPKFIQATLMYDLQWRIKRLVPDGVLSKEEEAEYLKCIEFILKHIDDDVIAIQRQSTAEIKVFAYMIKYGREAKLASDGEGGLFVAHQGNLLFSLSNCSVCLQFIEFCGSKVTIDGFVNMFCIPFESFEIKLLVNEEPLSCEMGDVEAVGALNTEYLNQHHFSCTASLKKGKNKISVVVCINGIDITLKNITFGKFFPISDVYSKAYYYIDKKMLTVKDESIIIASSCGLKRAFREIAFLVQMWRKNLNGGRNAVKARLAMKLLRFKWKKPIWLISDRASKAEDNGEAFFRYMTAEHPEIDAYYVINKKCDDYKRLSKIGKVTEKESFNHKLLLLMSDYIISSHAEDDIYNPFYTYNHGYRDILYKKKRIFLQHGITKDDVSSWLNKRKKNFYGFVTAARPEYESIIEGNFHYDESNVWLTGFARFDRLYNDEQNQITLMPTWRKYLFTVYDEKSETWQLSDKFENSRFVSFYSGLLSNKKLLDAAEKFGYKLSFLPHPTLVPYLEYFKCDDRVEVLGVDASYREVYAHSNLVLTDYSSAVFDFAYLKKPVLYSHFDSEEFFGGSHAYEKGYFDYERDGFGEVEYDLDNTVSRIIEYMKNDCKMKDKYIDRVESFFAFSDKENCRRIYEKIKELESKA